MKLVVCQNHLGGQILYRSLDPTKKRRQSNRQLFFQQAFRLCHANTATIILSPEYGQRICISASRVHILFALD